jgi:hypothetical protein
MSIPDWVIPLLQQFPIVGIVLGTVWLMVRWSDRRRRDDLVREQERTNEITRRADAEITRAREDIERAQRNHDAEIRRMARQHEAHVVRLDARIEQLEARLDDEDYS